MHSPRPLPKRFFASQLRDPHHFSLISSFAPFFFSFTYLSLFYTVILFAEISPLPKLRRSIPVPPPYKRLQILLCMPVTGTFYIVVNRDISVVEFCRHPHRHLLCWRSAHISVFDACNSLTIEIHAGAFLQCMTLLKH